MAIGGQPGGCEWNNRADFSSVWKPVVQGAVRMRKDVEFNAEGTTLRGWLYLPSGQKERVPVVVMAHGFSGVKEQYLDRYAEAFADVGLAALVYDNRCFGASDGEPRQEADPILQARDYRHAITYAQTLPEIDKDRIGVWGSSFSGGHALFVGAVDRRVKCEAAACGCTAVRGGRGRDQW
jgi:uncharacterized protein